MRPFGLELILDLAPHLVERACGGFAPLGQPDDVQPELRTDDVADLTGCEGERRFFEFLGHLAAAEEVQVPATSLSCLFLRVLGRKFGKILTRASLLQHRLGTLPDFCLVLSFRAKEDMTGPDLFGR